MRAVLLTALCACSKPTSPPEDGTSPDGAEDTWVAVGETCEVFVGTRDPQPRSEVACVPRPLAWSAGPVSTWARATIRSPVWGDRLGSELGAVSLDPSDGHALVVGAPHVGMAPLRAGSGSGTAETQDSILPWPRVYAFRDLVGDVPLLDSDIVLAETNSSSEPSVGQSVAAFPDGRIVAGDYWVNPGAGTVYLLEVSTDPVDVTPLVGGDGEACGADVAVADIDASGTPDVLTTCLGLIAEPDEPLLRGWRQRSSDGEWVPFAWLWPNEGSPSTWFGRPTVGGFDLDGDGVSDLALGDQHGGVDLESAVHVVLGGWRGTCRLEDLDAVTLWHGFTPATLAAADMDGDAVGDLLVGVGGMPAWSLHPEPFEGAVYVLTEPPTPADHISASTWLTLEGTDPEEMFGQAVEVGDFNGDGCPDIAVGAGEFIGSPTTVPGRVYVFAGPFEGGVVRADEADAVLVGAAVDDGFGSRLQVGDYDGDGIDDLAIAAPRDSRLADEAGSVYVLAGAREP